MYCVITIAVSAAIIVPISIHASTTKPTRNKHHSERIQSGSHPFSYEASLIEIDGQKYVVVCKRNAIAVIPHVEDEANQD